MILEAELSLNSLAKLERQLQQIGQNFDKIGDYTIQYMLEKGKAYCQERIKDLVNAGYSTGELLESVETELVDHVGYLRVTSPHAAYREFGIGIRGEGTYPSDGPFEPDGYRTTMWTYYNDQLGKYVLTSGYAAGHYMHDTYMYLKTIQDEALEYGLERGLKDVS